MTYLMVVAGQAVHHAKICFEVDYVWESRIFVTAQFLILLGVCIEVFLTDRGRPLGKPLTAGLQAVNPVCWAGAPTKEDTRAVRRGPVWPAPTPRVSFSSRKQCRRLDVDLGDLKPSHTVPRLLDMKPIFSFVINA